MRGGRSFVILLAVAACLGAYIFFVENKREPSDATAKKDKLFAGVDGGKIEEIEIHAANGDVTHLKKNGDKWEITAPAQTEADSTEISGLTSALESAEIQRVLDAQPKSVSDYGLAPARFTVAFRQTGETAMHQLDVGSKSPTGSDLYAQVAGQPRLLLISSSLEDSLDRTTFNLRDKAVLAFDRTGADSLALDPPGGPAMSFARKGDAWRLTAPVDARADFSAVDALVEAVFSARMKSIVSTTPPDAAALKKYGLDKPQATVTVGVGSTRATLQFGGKMDDTSLYARDVSRPMVFTVEPSFLDTLKKKPDDLRVKDAFDFRTFTALGVDLTLDGQAVSYAKVKAPPAKKDDKTKSADTTTPDTTAPSEVWKETKPAAKDVDQTKVTDLLTDLSNLKADHFTDKPFTSGQELVVVARFGDDASPKDERVTLRKSGDVVQAIRAGDAGAAVIPTADFDKVVKELKDLAGLK